MRAAYEIPVGGAYAVPDSGTFCAGGVLRNLLCKKALYPDCIVYTKTVEMLMSVATLGAPALQLVLFFSGGAICLRAHALPASA